MLSVISILAPIFGLIAFGAITARRHWLGSNATDVLNRFVVRLALPAELFQITAKVPLAQLDHPGFAAAFGIGMLLTFAVAWILCWRRRGGQRYRLSTATIEGLSVGYANTSFIGIPVCLGVFGASSMAAITLSTLLTACALFALAILMMEADRPIEEPPLAMVFKVVRALAFNPLIFAPIAGIAVNIIKFPIPAPGMTFITLLAGAASPCALLTIGMFLAQSERTSVASLPVILRLTAMKLLLHPALTLLFAVKVFALEPRWANEALLLSALPTGTGPFMLARIYQREASIASNVTLLTTVMSVIKIAAVLAWINPL